MQYREGELLNKIVLRLKRLREKKGVSQEQVYNETDIHIARIETAKNNPTITTIARLCDYFEISLAEFFRGI